MKGALPFFVDVLPPKYTPVMCAVDTYHIYKPNTLTLSYPMFMLINVAELPPPDFLPTLLNSVFKYFSSFPNLTEPDSCPRTYRVSSECVIEFFLLHMLQTINTLVPNLHLEPYPRMLQY